MNINNIYSDEKTNLINSDEKALSNGGSDCEYTVILDMYTGPLELLLTLVKSSKIKIEEIFVSEVTNQYIEFMSQLSTVDINRASEFLSVAAVLLEIKSKALLPHSEEIEEEVEDSKREFIRKLEEYRLIKEASEKLKASEIVGAYERDCSVDKDDSVTVLKDMTTQMLMSALNRLFLKLEKRIVPISRRIILDKFTVQDKIKHIKNIISSKVTCNFDELFEDDCDKSEIITTFQALLELLMQQEIIVIQTEVYGKIEIKGRLA